MRTAIISIGDELLIGQVINTNAAYLGEKLLSLGLPAEKVFTISDNKASIINSFRNIYNEFEIIIVTGGLGPTHDDITRNCIAEFFGQELVEDKKVLSNIHSIFKRRNIKPPSTVSMQALVPAGCKVLYNKAGTAPGMLFNNDGKIFAAMPGVPHEVYYIWENQLEPYLKKNVRTYEKIITRTIHTIGISESMLSQRIGSIENLNKSINIAELSLAYLPSNFEVRLRLTVKAENKKNAQIAMRNYISHIKRTAGEFVYSYKAETQSSVIGKLLNELGFKLAVAESCTGGLVSSKITDNAGSSDYFMQGIISYSNESKKNILGVKTATMKKYGAVSQQTAIEMAKGARKITKADAAISTTGIAGPGGAVKDKPVGLVWIGYSDNKTSFAKKFIFVKDRSRNKEIMSKMALDILRKELIRIRNDRNKRSS